MRSGYIAVVGPEAGPARSTLRALSGYTLVVDTPVVTIACGGDADHLAFGEGRGVIIGTVFGAAALPPLTSLREDVEAAAFASAGALLVDHLWGSYVAFLVQEDGRVAIVRDPSGATSCYWATVAGACVITSDIRACVTLGLIPLTIDWKAVAGHLCWPERRTQRTCLRGIDELLPGCRMVVDSAATAIDSVWQPWRFAAARMRIDDAQDAAAAVRRAVTDTVMAWQERYPRPLVSLSGGLDSSIVMASTANAAAAVTFVTGEPLGDERRYAGAVAEHCGTRLIACGLDPDRVAPGRSNASRLPRPVSRLFAQELDRIWRETATATLADAMFHGGGGDNVFCYLASATPYLDSLLVRGPGKASLAVLASLSRLTRVSAWRIRRAALRKLLVDRGRYRWHRDFDLLTVRAVRMGERVADHPWFTKIPSRILPGKHAHVAALVRIQHYLEAAEPTRVVPVIAPLMSQPVMEICLRVPTWRWCEGGVNRAVAREAFRDLLPASVVERRGKGSPAAFDARIVATRRGEIRALLSGGHLARQGLINSDAVAEALDGEGPLRGNRYLRVTELVDVEAWVQSWIGAPGGGRAQN